MSSSESSNFRHEWESCLYDCGDPTPLRVSTTPENPERRFYRCGWFDNTLGRKCNFFVWYDPPLTGRTRHVILRLKEENTSLCSELEQSFMQQTRLLEEDEKLKIQVKMLETEGRNMRMSVVERDRARYFMLLFLVIAGSLYFFLSWIMSLAA
ncbi:hypothetical protein Tsubulata_042554 [Turnera subulata]|uniref:GRF-type domain-containing protein n=1 Tax=Turnera subulata TaxID=218843 RepID=A0A9Q0GGF7_9ROSI|nr:hypothetical protein Tsubulata_042554 [Turnera subulata]